MPDESVLTLSRVNSTPHNARSFVEQHLVRVPASVCQDVVLLVSELVTNVVRHGAEPASLRLAVDAQRIEVVVADSGPELPLRPSAAVPDTGASTGRGLIIVAALATSWGVRRIDSRPGKEVWFAIEL